MIVVAHHTRYRLKTHSVLVLFLVSLGLWLAAATWYGRTALFIQTAVPVTGTVIDVIQQGKGYSPLIRFDNTAGEQFRFKPHSTQSPTTYAIGDQVSVYFDAARPAHSKVNSFASLWLGPMLLALAALANTLLAIIFHIALKRRQRSN